MIVRDLPESRLSEPVSAWMTGLGFSVWAEVPFYGSAVDLVGMRASKGRAGGLEILEQGAVQLEALELVAIELKKGLNRKAIQQAMIDQIFADRVYIGVGVRPRSAANLQWCRKVGLGVLWVEGSPVPGAEPVRHMILEAGPRNEHLPSDFTKRQMAEKLRKMSPGGTGGLPCLAGCGPLQDVEWRVAEYRRGYPQATWREIWKAVGSYHRSPASLAAAIRANQRRRVYRAAVKNLTQRRGGAENENYSAV